MMRLRALRALRASSDPHASCQARRASPGFTLIELLVSLTAGLVVALAVFALAGATSKTFQDEARVAGTELTVRLAIDRLRADFMRASYMSTGNLQADPKLAETATSRTAGPAGLRGLAGLRYVREGSVNATIESGVNFSTLNGVAPDQIILGGNFTTTEEFVVNAIADGACTTLWLVADSPALWRVTVGAFADGGTVASVEQQAALRNAFQPVPGASQFFVRVTDDSGHSQFMQTCNSPPEAAGFVGTAPFVRVQGSLLSGAQTGTVGGANGLGVGRITVNPVQLVSWQMVAAGGVGAEAGAAATPDNRARYNLVRQFLDVARTPVGTPEIIAEYVVDLKFGFTVNAEIATDAGTVRALSILPIGHTDNELWAYDTASGAIAGRGPQRIRSVRVRMATRTPFADRNANVVAPADYLYRYCIDPVTDLAQCHQFARVRTVTTEIALPNQMGMFY